MLRESEKRTRYFFKYVEGPVLYKELIDLIVEYVSRGYRELEISLDIGLSREKVSVEDNRIFIRDSEFSIDFLKKTIEKDFLYKIIDQRIHRLDFYKNNKYYKLKPSGLDKAPTVEISGVQMHRTTEIDPWTDSLIKIKTLGNLRNRKALDICTGLGYTAINMFRRGVKEIFTIEIDENILHLAEMNPWSRVLEKIDILLGDASEIIDYFDNEYFDVILHDPPRINIAGELYSEEFYRKIYRVLKRGGRLFHYTGEPGRHSNIDILKGIKNRLKRAGFDEIRWIDKAKGFLVFKY
ncbi:MAG: class I SAM-dependent methyltransferase [Sulfolobales archaeon]